MPSWNALPESVYAEIRLLCGTTTITRTEIATRLGCSLPVVCRIANAAGFKATRGPKRDPALRHDYFQIIDTEEKAYWLGFLSADGCVYKPKTTNSYRIEINLQDSDEGHLRKFLNAVSPNQNICHYKSGGRIYHSITVFSNQLGTDLIRHGVTPRKSLTLQPWNGPAHLMRHYWRGMVDGDGCICDGKKIWLALCGTHAVVEAFAEYGRKVTNSVMKVRQPKPNNWHIAFGEKKAKELARHLYEGATVSLHRKQVKAEALMARVFLGYQPWHHTEETKTRMRQARRKQRMKPVSAQTRALLAVKARASWAKRRKPA